jgi:protein TonB
LSRSLVFAFLAALILHSLLAWAELDVFRRPVHGKKPLRTLTIDIVRPRPVKKRTAAKEPPLVIKQRSVQASIKKKVTPKKRVEPKVIIEPGKEPVSKENEPKRDEKVAHLKPAEPPSIRKGAASEKNNRFVPDMVDIPIAPPKTGNTTEEITKKESRDVPLAPPITYALPNYKQNSPPTYPLLARRRNYQGTVLLEVLVTREGKVGSVRLARSSGFEVLDRAAVKGVRKWLFHPGKRGDEVVEMWVKVPIRFQLR